MLDLRLFFQNFYILFCGLLVSCLKKKKVIAATHFTQHPNKSEILCWSEMRLHEKSNLSNDNELVCCQRTGTNIMA